MSRFFQTVLSVAWLSLAGASFGGAIGVAPGLPTNFSFSGADFVRIGDFDAYIEVTADPNGGAWTKTLTDSPVVQVGGQLHVLEFLSVGGDIAWTDWHEEILTPGWIWAEGDPNGIWAISAPPIVWTPLFENGNFAGGSSTAASFEMNANSISILFENPFPPGSLLVIEKLLEWQGVPGTAPQAWQGGVIQVTEYPTVPIPATLLLMVLGLAGFGIQRRKQVKTA